MKQLNFFSKTSNEKSSTKSHCDESNIWKLYTDGASRNNPGPAGVGFSLTNGTKTVCEQGFYIGNKTNNQAEYTALIVGIIFAKKFMKASDTLAIFSDSQLLVRQMNGQYRVKDAQLKQLQAIAYDLLKNYSHSFCHVYREDNTRADEMANRGLDKKISLPKKVLDILRQ